MIYPTKRLLGFAVPPALLSLVAIGVQALTLAACAAWLLVGAVAILDARNARQRAPLVVRRLLPRRARVGVPVELGYEIEAGDPAPSQASLLDELPADLGGDVVRARVELRDGRATLSYRVTPTRRGLRSLGRCHAFAASGLGLWVQRSEALESQVLSVLPRDCVPGREGLSTPRSRRELGLRPRRPRGEGLEFESLREYTPDDEPRRIDWRASARCRSPVVRDYQVERNHTVLIAIDCGRLMSTQLEGQSKLDHALHAAVGLVRACAGVGDRVGLAAFDREVCAWVQPQTPRRALGPILEATLPLQPSAHEASYRALAETLQRRQKKRALLVVLTDFVEGGASRELESYLSSLAKRHCVLLIGLRDRLLEELRRPRPALHGIEVYRRLVLQDLDAARHRAMARIARIGVHTLDLDPTAITAPMLDRYLAIREAGLV